MQLKIKAVLLGPVLLSMTTLLLAQTTHLSGRVLDSATHQPLVLVTVSLLDQKKSLIQRMISDSTGTYSFPAVKYGQYTLQFTMTGFMPFESPVFLPEGEMMHLPDYFLSSSYRELATVAIIAQRPLITPQADGFLYNAQNDIPVAGEKVSDVLRKLPGVMVSPDGAPSIRGSGRIKVFIDGKPSESYAATLADALRQVSSENIASIEIITHPSAKYEGEGVDGVINITTVRPLQNGTSGNINLMLANRNKTASVNLLMRRKDWIISTDLGHYDLSINVLANTLRHGQGTLSGLGLQQQRFSEINRRNKYGGLRFIWLADSLSSFNLGYRATRYHDNLYHTYENVVPAAPSADSSARFTDNPIRRWAHNLSGGYARKSRDKKTEFNLLLLATQNSSENGYGLQEERMQAETYRETNNNQSLIREAVGQADYAREMKNAKLEAGMRYSYRLMDNESDFHVYDYAAGSYYRDDRRSNSFGQRMGIAALYLSYGFTLGNYKLRTGIRYENTFLRLTANNAKLNIPRYGSLLPNFMISRTVNSSLTFTAGYSKRIQRPYSVYLNPVVNYMDSLNIEYGNPNLKPVLIHNYTLTYSYQKRKILIDGSFFATHSAGNIEYVRTLQPNGVTESSWFNISAYTVYGATFNFSRQGKHFTFRLNNTLRSVFFNTDGTFPEKSGLIFSQGGYFAYQFNKGYTLASYTNVNSRNISLQGYSSATYWYNVLLSKSYFDGKLSVAVRLDNFFNRYQYITEKTANESFSQQTTTRNVYRFFKFSLTCKIGKKEVRVPPSKEISGEN